MEHSWPACSSAQGWSYPRVNWQWAAQALWCSSWTRLNRAILSSSFSPGIHQRFYPEFSWTLRAKGRQTESLDIAVILEKQPGFNSTPTSTVVQHLRQGTWSLHKTFAVSNPIILGEEHRKVLARLWSLGDWRSWGPVPGKQHPQRRYWIPEQCRRSSAPCECNVLLICTSLLPI